MTAMYALFVVGIVVIAAVGLWVLATTPTEARWFQNVLVRFQRIRDVCVEQLGRHIAAVFVLLAGAAAAVIISWPFGRFARRFVSSIDRPFENWVLPRVAHSGTWHHFNSVATNMGNRPVIKFLVPIAAVVLAVIWAYQKRGWWIPLLVIPLSYVFEKFGQSALAKVVDRPPTRFLHFGTYPSGGCARLLVVYGVTWYMVYLTFPRMGRRWRVIGFTVVAILAFIEGYTRIFLIKHWGLDVVGGWLYGTLLLLAVIGAASCFARRDDSASGRDVRADAGDPTAVMTG
jgi:membrane-associated phospholipid phosphatase